MKLPQQFLSSRKLQECLVRGFVVSRNVVANSTSNLAIELSRHPVSEQSYCHFVWLGRGHPLAAIGLFQQNEFGDSCRLAATGFSRHYDNLRVYQSQGSP